MEKSRGAGELLGKSAVARYIQLAGLFRRLIVAGEWRVGSQIPTVAELSSEYQVASMTIRQALTQLEKEGLIERFRAKGTFVRKRPGQDLWCEVQTDWNGLLMSRANAKISVLSDQRGTTLDQSLLEYGSVAPAYRHLRRLHTREEMPFLIADVYIDERLRSLIPEERYTTTTAMRLVSELPGVKIVDARQILSIGEADPETASYLEIPLGAPIAVVQRLAINDQGVLILVANGLYRGDKVRIDMKLLK